MDYARTFVNNHITQYRPKIPYDNLSPGRQVEVLVSLPETLEAVTHYTHCAMHR
jgi:hypothetical protein